MDCAVVALPSGQTLVDLAAYNQDTLALLFQDSRQNQASLTLCPLTALPYKAVPQASVSLASPQVKSFIKIG